MNNKNSNQNENKRFDRQNKYLTILGLILIFLPIYLLEKNDQMFIWINWIPIIVGSTLIIAANYRDRTAKISAIFQVAHQKANFSFDNSEIRYNSKKGLIVAKWGEITKFDRQGDVVILYTRKEQPIIIKLSELSTEECYFLESKLTLYG